MKKLRAVGAIVLFLAVAAAAQEKIEDIAKAAPSRARYPDSSAVIVRSSETFTLAPGGGTTEEYFRALEIFNLTGREKFSDFRIPFDKKNDRIEVALAQTVRGDGKVVDVEAKAINDVTPPELAEADLYANIVHRVLSFPAVDPGALLAVRYTKASAGAGELEGVVYFQSDEPIVRKDLTIVVPGDRELKYRIRGLAAGLEPETAEGRKVYRLRAADSPQIKPETDMPPLQEIASRIVFSTWPSWRSAASRFAASFFAAAVPGPEVESLTKDLVKGASGDADKIRALFSFVARNVRSVRFALGEGGYEVHAAETVLKNRYGDWKDKAALLVALLKAAGFEACPVLVNARAVAPEEDVPTLRQFDALLVAVAEPAHGGWLFLDPFADDSLFGYFREGRNSRGLLVKAETAEFVDVRCRPEAESVARLEFTAELDRAGGIRGRLSADLAGLFDQRARRVLKDMTAKEREVFFAESINKLCEDGKAVRNDLSDARDLATPVRISQEFEGPGYGLFQGPIMLVRLPEAPYSFADLPSAPSLAKRRYPFRLAGEAKMDYRLSLKIPPGFKPLYLPGGFSYQKDYGEFTLTASYDPAKGMVTIEETLVLAKRDIPLDQYDEFKKIIDSFGTTQNTLMLFEKK